MNDYYVVVVNDACGTFSGSSHSASLDNIRDAYGVVCDTDDLRVQWNSTGPPGRARKRKIAVDLPRNAWLTNGRRYPFSRVNRSPCVFLAGRSS